VTVWDPALGRPGRVCVANDDYCLCTFCVRISTVDQLITRKAM
jgi:hypothetical protein